MFDLRRRAKAFQFLCGLLLSIPSTCLAQNHIVLRDLSLMPNISVAEMNVDGLTLANGKSYAWSEIKQGDVGDLQTQFDQYLHNVGGPLFSVRARLAARDFDELEPLTETLFDQLAIQTDRENSSGNSTGITEYFANAAKFQMQMAKGNRELAVIPFLQILKLRQMHPTLAELDTETGIKFSETGIASNLLPIWFDQQLAVDALKQITTQHLLSEPTKLENSPAFLTYACSLNIAAKPNTDLSKWQLPETWRAILSAQSLLLNSQPQKAKEVLSKLPKNLAVEQQALAVYYLGVIAQKQASTSFSQPDQQNTNSTQWILELLKVPANYEARFPELSAAALHQIVKQPKIAPAIADKLKAELTGQFSGTFYGRQWSGNDQR